MTRLLVLLKPLRWRFILLLGLILCSATLPLATPRLIGLALDYGILPSSASVDERREMLSLILCAIVGIELLSYLVRQMKDFRSHVLTEAIVQRVRETLFGHIQTVTPLYCHNEGSGSLSTKIIEESRILSQHLMSVTVVALTAPLSFVAIAIVLSLIDFKLTCLALLPVPFLYIVLYAYVKAMRRHGRHLRDAQEALASYVHERISGLETVQSFRGEREERLHFHRSSEAYRDARLRVAGISTRYFPAVGLLFGMGSVIILLYSGLYQQSESLSAGDIVSFLVYVGILYSPLMSLSGAHHAFQEVSLSSERVFAILDQTPEVQDGRLILEGVVESIDFHDVQFAYHRNGEAVLRSVTGGVRRGRMIGITGSSGAGKTTLAYLLTRFYDPTSGTIVVNGKDIREYTIHSVRREIVLLSDAQVLFQGSLRANIVYGLSDTSDEDVWHAAACAEADVFINRLPLGYDTKIAEGGIGLSEGERQRLAIARGLVRKPSVLILDEVTSGIDEDTEKRIIHKIRTFMNTGIVIMISHRSSVLAQCDEVYGMHEGAITFETKQQI